MDAKTLEALQGSIAKWESIVAGTGADKGSQNCPLCLLFNPWPGPDELRRADRCRGCPVSTETGMQFCDGTPYEELEAIECDGGTGSDEYKEAAKKELDFLKSLLPQAELADTAGQRQNEPR